MQTNKTELYGRSARYWFPCILLIVALALACFAPWLAGGKVLAPLDITSEMLLPWRGDQNLPKVHNHFVVDAVGHYLPYRLLAQQSLQEDGYVGWNPLVFGGSAQYANTMLINYDWSVLLHRFVPFWAAWTGGRLGQILLAGLGMLLFLAGRGYERGPATLGAVAYMLNQQFVAWIYFNQVVAAFCWVPFILWSLYGALEKSTRYVSLAAIFLALSLLGSTLQQAAFVAAVFFCTWLGILIDRSTTWQKAWKITVVFAASGVLGSALVAFMLEPTMHSFFENERTGHGRGGFTYEAGFLQPLLHAVAQPLTVFPSVMGSASTLDLWKIFKLELYTVGFFGTLPMVIACLALFARTVPAGAKLLVLAGALVPLTPLVGFLYHRFNVVWILGGCWACAAWLASASPELTKRFSDWVWRIGVFAVFLWLAASAAIAVFNKSLASALQAKIEDMSSSSAFGVFSDWMQARGIGFLDYFCVWNPWQLLMLSGAAISIWGISVAKSNRFFLQMAPAFGVAMQLNVFWWQWTTWQKPELAYNNHELVAVLQREVGKSGRLALDSSTWAETMFPPNMLMPAGVAITGGYDAIQPFGMKSPSENAWDFPGTTHFLGKMEENGPKDWTEVWSDGQWHLLRNPEQAVGVIALSEGKTPLSTEKFFRPTLNTMEVLAPVATTRLVLYSNWNRGWQWLDPADNVWKNTGKSAIHGVQVDLQKPLASESVIKFRYVPATPRWTIVLTLTSLLVVSVVAAFGRKTHAY